MNKGMPFVSVIVLNYNGSKHLSDCLKSLNETNYPRKSFEVILADNCSTDDSIELTVKNFSFVKIVKHDRNHGFSDGNNLTVKYAKGEYLSFLNNDTVVDRNWLKEIMDCLDSETMIYGSKIMNFYDRNKIDSLGGRITFTGKGYDLEAGKSIKGNQQPYFTGFVCGAALTIKKSFFDEVNGFDSNYFIYEDDVDLGWKAWLLGYKVKVIPSSIVFHKFGGLTGKRLSSTRIFYSQRNALMNVTKNLELRNLFIAYIVVIGFSLMEELILLFRLELSKLHLIPKAYACFFWRLDKTLMNRVDVQDKRKKSDKELIELGVIDSVKESFKEYLRVRFQ